MKKLLCFRISVQNLHAKGFPQLKDLKETLHKELSGYFRLAVRYSFYDKAHVNAMALYRAMKGLGTDETVLIDVICSCTNQEIHELREAYNDSALAHSCHSAL